MHKKTNKENEQKQDIERDDLSSVSMSQIPEKWVKKLKSSRSARIYKCQQCNFLTVYKQSYLRHIAAAHKTLSTRTQTSNSQYENKLHKVKNSGDLKSKLVRTRRNKFSEIPEKWQKILEEPDSRRKLLRCPKDGCKFVTIHISNFNRHKKRCCVSEGKTDEHQTAQSNTSKDEHLSSSENKDPNESAGHLGLKHYRYRANQGCPIESEGQCSMFYTKRPAYLFKHLKKHHRLESKNIMANLLDGAFLIDKDKGEPVSNPKFSGVSKRNAYKNPRKCPKCNFTALYSAQLQTHLRLCLNVRISDIFEVDGSLRDDWILNKNTDQRSSNVKTSEISRDVHDKNELNKSMEKKTPEKPSETSEKKSEEGKTKKRSIYKTPRMCPFCPWFSTSNPQTLFYHTNTLHKLKISELFNSDGSLKEIDPAIWEREMSKINNGNLSIDVSVADDQIPMDQSNEEQQEPTALTPQQQLDALLNSIELQKESTSNGPSLVLAKGELATEQGEFLDSFMEHVRRQILGISNQQSSDEQPQNSGVFMQQQPQSSTFERRSACSEGDGMSLPAVGPTPQEIEQQHQMEAEAAREAARTMGEMLASADIDGLQNAIIDIKRELSIVPPIEPEFGAEIGNMNGGIGVVGCSSNNNFSGGNSLLDNLYSGQNLVADQVSTATTTETINDLAQRREQARNLKLMADGFKTEALDVIDLVSDDDVPTSSSAERHLLPPPSNSGIVDHPNPPLNLQQTPQLIPHNQNMQHQTNSTDQANKINQQQRQASGFRGQISQQTPPTEIPPNAYYACDFCNPSVLFRHLERYHQHLIRKHPPRIVVFDDDDVPIDETPPGRQFHQTHRQTQPPNRFVQPQQNYSKHQQQECPRSSSNSSASYGFYQQPQHQSSTGAMVHSGRASPVGTGLNQSDYSGIGLQQQQSHLGYSNNGSYFGGTPVSGGNQNPGSRPQQMAVGQGSSSHQRQPHHHGQQQQQIYQHLNEGGNNTVNNVRRSIPKGDRVRNNNNASFGNGILNQTSTTVSTNREQHQQRK